MTVFRRRPIRRVTIDLPADLHHLLGDVDEKLGDSLEAVRHYQRAAELDPSEPHLFDWAPNCCCITRPRPPGKSSRREAITVNWRRNRPRKKTASDAKSSSSSIPCAISLQHSSSNPHLPPMAHSV